MFLGGLRAWIFGFFGFSPNGKPRASLDSSRPGKSKNGIFGQKIQVFGAFSAISHYLGVPPGVPPSLLLAPLGHLTVLIASVVLHSHFSTTHLKVPPSVTR